MPEGWIVALSDDLGIGATAWQATPWAASMCLCS